MSDRAEALRRALIEIEREISFGSHIEYIQQIARIALDRDQGRRPEPGSYEAMFPEDAAVSNGER